MWDSATWGIRIKDSAMADENIAKSAKSTRQRNEDTNDRYFLFCIFVLKVDSCFVSFTFSPNDVLQKKKKKKIFFPFFLPWIQY